MGRIAPGAAGLRHAAASGAWGEVMFEISTLGFPAVYRNLNAAPVLGRNRVVRGLQKCQASRRARWFLVGSWLGRRSDRRNRDRKEGGM